MRSHVRILFVVLALTALILAGQPLITKDAARPADIIVVIGGDHKPERIARAAELYRAGYAPRVLLSAGTVVKEGDQWMPEAQVMLHQAIQAGIPQDAILLEQESQSTVENARFSKPILQENQFRSILLVTSPYQSARARRVFSDTFGGDIIIISQPALGNQFYSLCWWFQTDQQGVVLSEYWKWLVYLTLHQ